MTDEGSLIPLDAEMAALHVAFWSPIAATAAKITGAQFYDPRRGALWDALMALQARDIKPDVTTIAKQMGIKGEKLAELGMLLMDVTDSSHPAHVGNITEYAAVITDRAERRRLLNLVMPGARQRLLDINQPLDEGVAYLERGISGTGALDHESDQLFTYDEFINQNLPPLEWVIPNLMAREERLVLTGGEGSGKALATSTRLPTPTGWTTMGLVQAGDILLGADGKPTRVIFATKTMRDHDCYEVSFSDGSSVIADADHRWLTESYVSRMKTAKARNRTEETKSRGTDQRAKRTQFPSVVTTREIAETLYARGGHTLNHTIDAAAPLDLPEADLPIDPYLFGAWLGDGTSLGGEITQGDEDLAHMVAEVTRAGFIPTPRRDRAAWRIGITTTPGAGRHGRSFVGALRRLGVLGNKHIPQAYLRGSFSQRLALLQGLMDTDGTVSLGSGKGRGQGAAKCEFCVVDEHLGRDVLELIVSLGIITRIAANPARLYGKDCGTRYRIHFQTELPVFRLARKAERLIPLRTQRSQHRFITAVTPVPSVPVRCVQVDNEDHLYLCGDGMIPTHNTMWLRQIAMCAAAGVNPLTLHVMTPRNVLVVDCENPNRIMINKFTDIGQALGKMHRKPQNLSIRRFPEGMDLGAVEDRMKLRRLCQITQPDLVVAGPVYKMYVGGSNSREEDLARVVVSALDALREEFKFALILEHHQPKGSGGTRDGAPIGSSLWMRWPEFGFSLKLTEESTFHDRQAELVRWRGDRDDRDWPKYLTSGGIGNLPWIDSVAAGRP